MDTSPIIIEQLLTASRSDIWRAITEIDQMRRWYFQQIVCFRPEVGFQTRFTVGNEGRAYEHIWTITEVIPQERIAYSWQFSGIEGEGLTTWQLEDVQGGTRLTLTNHGLHTFSRDDPAFTRESCEGGWRYFLVDRLPAFLALQSSTSQTE